jgi:myo-inositol 2-dehydrogenase / D-chiro-inositol 1-dehydrogenase
MRKIKCGLIGTGLMGSAAHLYNLGKIPDADVVAICDSDPEHLQSATQYVDSTCKLYTDSDKLIEDPEVEAVFIATPNHTHRQMAEKAFSLGKDVFTEKPMAATLEDCRAMIEASEKAGKILQVGLLCRYNPQFHKFVEIVNSGEIGNVQMMFCKEFRAPFQNLLVQFGHTLKSKSGQFADSADAVAGAEESNPEVSLEEQQAWWRMQQISGGALVEKNCHHFDVFNWMLNDNVRAKRVFATGGQNVHKQFEIVDHAWVTVDYENGVKACLGLCFFAPWGEEVEWWAIGDKGKVECHLHHEEIHLIKSFYHKEIIKVPFPEPREIGHRGSRVELEEFIRAVQTRSKPYASGKIGLRSVEIPVAAEKSIREGVAVEIE